MPAGVVTVWMEHTVEITIAMKARFAQNARRKRQGRHLGGESMCSVTDVFILSAVTATMVVMIITEHLRKMEWAYSNLHLQI